MIWNFFIISLGLATARDIYSVEPEYLDELKASGRDEELAKLLGINRTLIRPADAEQRSEVTRYNQVSHLGDIVLTEEQDRQGLNFDRYTTYKWPNRRIPYTISSEFSDREKGIIQNAISAFNRVVRNLQIVPRRRERDYVFVMNGNGCWSHMGKKGGQQSLSLQKNGCVTSGTVQHEFLHAAGMAHEHNRHDRDTYVRILWDNIPTSWHSQYQKVDASEYWNLGKYDYCSCMHYPIWSPETYKDAFEFKRTVNRSCVGQDHGVTPDDIFKVNEHYKN